MSGKKDPGPSQLRRQIHEQPSFWPTRRQYAYMRWAERGEDVAMSCSMMLNRICFHL